MKKKIAIILVISMVFSSVGLNFGANASDLQNHWGSGIIQEWIGEGFINGYPDGSFRPDNAITRAEFMVLVNKAFEFEIKGSINYIDVANTDWYCDAIRVASASSYIEGYPDGSMKPNNPISRQEVTVILSKITSTQINSGIVTAFSDANEIAPWAKDSVEAAVTKGYMQGYPDGTFKPKNNITRAEAVITLNKTLTVKEDKEIVVYNKAGIYGTQTGITTIRKDVVIESDGVTLQNMVIKGNLTIAEVVGTGDVFLNNITVEGETFIRGGGEDSIHIDGGNYNKIIVQKTSSGNVRIVATNIDGLEIIISEAAEGQAIILEGSFDSVTIEANDIEVVIQGETIIDEFLVNKGVKDLSVSLGDEASIGKLYVNSKIEVMGKGTIEVASGKEVNNSTYQKAPDRIINSSSGGSSGGENPSRVAVSAVSVIGNNTVVNGGTLQLGVSVTPVNATDKSVIWSVAPGTGLATISGDGLLTATSLGTVTVTATNVASGVSGTKLITVTTAPNGNQLAPIGLTGVAPITLGGSDGKITGTTTAMEYKLATDADWIQVIGTEINGLATGIYNVRYTAKDGYNAGASAYVIIFADNYESEEGDNSYQTAKLIATDGTLQTHAIYPAGDEDWVKFYAEAGNIYQIATSNLIDDPSNQQYEYGMDTYIELYNMDGRTLIVYNDDNEKLDSKISWHCSTTGTYYVRIMHYTHIDYDFYNPDTGTGSYDISITKSAATELLSINIVNWGYKYNYYVGDLLDITGLVVLGEYSDVIDVVEKITAANVTGFNSSVPAANQELTVTINGKTDTYNINIEPAPVVLSGISVSSAGDVTTVANNRTLQMSANLTPPNATNVQIAWSVVTLENGTATINRDGLLTATGVGTVAVTATDIISEVYGTKIITITMGEQLAPTGLVGVAPTTFAGSNGKITGTTTAMEYKLEADIDWIHVMGTEITGLTTGTYNVRYTAKTGFNAGTTADVTVPAYVANEDQNAPTGLVGIAPTTIDNNDGKITGTTVDMEYKLAGGTYAACSTEETIVAAGDYVVRFAARPGFNASPTTAVTVAAYVALVIPDTLITKGADLVDGAASFTWSSVNGIGSQNASTTSSMGYTYYTDGAYLRFQVKQGGVVKKFAEVFETGAATNDTEGGMTLQTNGGTINDMDGSNRERADWGVAGLEGYLTNLPNDGNYVFYGLTQSATDGTKTVGFVAGDSRTVNMRLTPKVDLVPGTYTLTVETLQQGSADIKGTINYTFEVIGPVSVEEITVKGAGNVTEVINGGTLQMSAVVLPEIAYNKEVTWTVEGGEGKATISTDGLLTAIEVGTVNVKVTANDGSKVVGQSIITITLTTPEVYFTFNAGEIKDYNTAGGVDIVIPSTIGGATVTKIGYQAFRGKGLTSVVMPDSVCTIDMGAFMLNSLTNIIIPDSVTSISASAFRSNQLASVTIPNNVTSIGQYAFDGNLTLTSLIIGDSVISIEVYAFTGAKLTNIAIPNSVKSIGEAAFYNNDLTNVTFGSNIESIGRFAFASNKLANITIPASVISLGDGAFSSNPPITNIIMEREDTLIGNNLLASNNIFKDAYTIGGAGTYTGTQWGSWTK